MDQERADETKRRHWADEAARTVDERTGTAVLSTGISPSGEIHVGNMREVLTADAVFRALRDLGRTPGFNFVADDLDPLLLAIEVGVDDLFDQLGHQHVRSLNGRMAGVQSLRFEERCNDLLHLGNLGTQALFLIAIVDELQRIFQADPNRRSQHDVFI